MSSALFYIHALTPMHMGTGAAVGAIDLPHSREAATRLPNIPGSGIKGVWRDQCRDSASHKSRLELLFGASREADAQSRDQGALLISDALLLAMPVASYVGDFGWVTSPLSLARLARERRFMGLSCPDPVGRLAAGEAQVTQGCALVHEKHLYLHELKLTAKTTLQAQAWAALLAAEIFSEDEVFKTAFIDRLVIACDSDLVLLSHSAAQVPVRNALDDNKNVLPGALWSEENMPAETLFWGTAAADTITDRDKKHPAADCLKHFSELVQGTSKLQVGGKASVGRGVCRFVMPGSQVMETA
jgi:CRISPR-associated protein Cmr4